tara:strand:- start:156 stop:428 length:273 start_codon:yes stop_codon:yes gene_type:complete
MEDFDVVAVMSGGEIVHLKQYGDNLYEVVDNLVKILEIENVLQIIRVSDQKIWNLKQKEIDFSALREARNKILNEANLKQALRDSCERKN